MKNIMRYLVRNRKASAIWMMVFINEDSVPTISAVRIITLNSARHIIWPFYVIDIYTKGLGQIYSLNWWRARSKFAYDFHFVFNAH